MKVAEGLVQVEIDGRSVRVAAGSTALDACRELGIALPTPCFDPRLKPAGACRGCLVRLDGAARPATACALVLADGMTIRTDEPDLVESRRAQLRWLAREYPREYLEAVPEKPFHQWLIEYDLVGATSPSRNGRTIDDSNPYFQFDPRACIECYKCVRACTELQSTRVWQIVDRGMGVHVAPDSFTTLAASSCKSCGACVDACPSGALIDKTRLADGVATKWTRTTCPYCGVGCELNVGTREGHIVQVRPVFESPVSRGHLCVKGRYANAYVEAPDRVTTPMIRRGGELVPCSWDEALETVAREFLRVAAERGPDAIGVLGSARAPNEDNYLAQKFARVVLGTNNVDCCARVCHGPTAAAMKAVLGTGAATNSFEDIESTSAIMVVGSNPTENHPIIGERILQAKERGARLIVIDPRRTEVAAHADVHVNLRPGANVPLLNATACAIFEEGLVDRRYLESRTDGADQFEAFVRTWTPERAAPICGVDAQTIRHAARIYASDKPAMCFHGLGMTEHLQGTEGVICLVNLALITGNMGKPGSGINPLRGQNNVQGSAHMGCEPSNLTGFVSVLDGASWFEPVWEAELPQSKGMNLMEMLVAARKGDFKALWAIGYDVYFTISQAQETGNALEAMEFVVVQDLFLNETARRYAHVFLPASSSFERDGTFMNAERRVQRVRAAIPPVGDTKPDWEIIQLVAQRMGHPNGFSFAGAEEIWDEVRKVWKPGAGMSYARLEEGGLQWPCTSEDHPGTKILHASQFPLGTRAKLQAIEYTPTPEVASPEYPFIMNTGRTLVHFNAGTMTYRTKNAQIRPSDTLDIHPEDARSLALATGDRARVVSRYGEAELPVRVDSGLRRGEVFATFHSREIFLNLVTSPVADRKVGAPEYKVTAVRIERIADALET